MPLGETFHDILSKRNMSLDLLSERAEVSPADLKAAASGHAELTVEQLDAVADNLGVPPEFLFADEPMPVDRMPDFRRQDVLGTSFSASLINAIAEVERLSFSILSLELQVRRFDGAGSYSGPLTKIAAKRLAQKWRSEWGLSIQDQVDLRGSSGVYKSLRLFIERKGIFVVHKLIKDDDIDISGIYTKVDGGPDFIIINTYGSCRARQLFTLAHEFAHVLIGKAGVSSTLSVRGRVEKFCNSFAAELLAPVAALKYVMRRFKYKARLDRDTLRLFSEKLGISQQCLALRLVEMGEVAQGEYLSWMAQFNGQPPISDQKDVGGPRGNAPPDPIKAKETQYGWALISTLAEAKRQKLIDALDVYRIAGIKTKYQRELLGV